MKHLNPKADLTFKRIFGEHPDLVISLLNALLPIKAIVQATGLSESEIQTLTNSSYTKPTS